MITSMGLPVAMTTGRLVMRGLLYQEQAWVALSLALTAGAIVVCRFAWRHGSRF
jgi:hypothetical protein